VCGDGGVVVVVGVVTYVDGVVDVECDVECDGGGDRQQGKEQKWPCYILIKEKKELLIILSFYII